MTRWMRRLRYWKNRSQMDADLAEEMEFHRAMLARQGAAAADWGNTTYAREEARAVWIWPWLESLWRDAAYAIRSMRGQPGFTAVALLGLAAAIGVNASLFTVFNGVALRPWPVKDPGRVVSIVKTTRDGAHDFAILEHRFFAEHARSVTGVIAFRDGERVKFGERTLRATYTSSNYFSALGVPMAMGRGFLPEEDGAGAPQAVVVLTHSAWLTAFGGDPQITGRTVTLDETPFTVVGVTSDEFPGAPPNRNDLWIPLSAKKILRPADPYVDRQLNDPDFCCTPMAARLAPGITRRQAEAELALLDARFFEQHKLKQSGMLRVTGTAWIHALGRKTIAVVTFTMLFLAVTLILLLACANVGNLLLARAEARRREIAVRLSIGGSRLRIVRQLLVESATLAFGAAALGLGIACVLPSALIRWLAGEQFSVSPDWSVLAYTTTIASVACLAFGLAPALHCTRGDTSAALKGEQPATRFLLRSFLLGAQVAISVLLLTGAGMLVRGLQRTQAQDPGFPVKDITVLAIDLPAQETGPARMHNLAEQLTAELERAPGLPSCGLAAYEPLGSGRVSTSIRLPGQREERGERIGFQQASPGFFPALGIPIVAGRNFAVEDGGREVAIVNEAAARRYWRGDGPVGKTFFWAGADREVIGVVRDAHLTDLRGVEPAMFVPISRPPAPPLVLARDRSAGGIERITAVIKRLEPRAQVRAQPLAVNFARQVQPSATAATLAGGMGLLALALASIGMSGVFAYVVRQRTREIGVRMAMGARPSDVVRLVLGSNFRVLAVGLLAGSAGAAAASVALASVAPGVKTEDPIAYAGVAVLLAAAAAVASIAPARRATRVDPVRALRCD